jgi:hypothetical protein
MTATEAIRDSREEPNPPKIAPALPTFLSALSDFLSNPDWIADRDFSMLREIPIRISNCLSFKTLENHFSIYSFLELKIHVRKRRHVWHTWHVR